MKRYIWHDFDTAGPDGFEHKIIPYGTNELQKIYLNIPAGKKNLPLVIWFHGGGFTRDIREIPSGLWNGELITAEVRYRLSDGTYKVTDSLEDGAAAIAEMFKHLEELSVNKDLVFLGGMSAGAYLAAMAAMAPHMLGKYGLTNSVFAGLMLISGQMTTHFRLKQDLNYQSEQVHPVIDQYAPLHYASKDIPPVLFVTGGSDLDMPARPEENAFMAATLRSMGHRHVKYYSLPGHNHGAAFESCDYLLMQFINNIVSSGQHN